MEVIRSPRRDTKTMTWQLRGLEISDEMNQEEAYESTAGLGADDHLCLGFYLRYSTWR
jgi:hypothetical protein